MAATQRDEAGTEEGSQPLATTTHCTGDGTRWLPRGRSSCEGLFVAAPRGQATWWAKRQTQAWQRKQSTGSLLVLNWALQQKPKDEAAQPGQPVRNAKFHEQQQDGKCHQGLSRQRNPIG